MDVTAIDGLARDGDYLAVVAVARPDGSVHASLVKAGMVDDPAGGPPRAGMVVAGNARKLAYLRGAGRATVVFRDGWRWASVEGPVTLAGPDDRDHPDEGDLPELLRRVYRAAGGTHDDWDEFDRAMATERRCAVLVRVERVSGNG